jgi:hypothetical protein
MVVPVQLRPTFATRPAQRLFDVPIAPGDVNDSHRWQVSADGQRFLFHPAAGSNETPPINLVVNWETLLQR